MDNLTIHDLLPIPTGTRQPHAYQVLGLEPGEQDASAIKSATAATVQRLKAAKATTEAKTWNRAARLVQQAREILSDPEKKAELDARFGIVPVGNPSSPAGQSPAGQSPAGQSPAVQSPAVQSPPPATPPTAATVDPLAAMLPASDPLAAALPSTHPLAPVAPEGATVVLPPPPAASEPAASESAASESAASELPPAAPTSDLPPASPPAIFAGVAIDSQGPPEPHSQGESRAASESLAPVVVNDPPPRTTRRRRKSLLGSLMFALFSLLMVSLIALLSYFVFFGPGQVAISKSNGGLTITTGPMPADRGLAINPPAATAGDSGEDSPAVRRRRDNVMGRLAGDMPPPASATPGSSPGSLLSSDRSPDDAPPGETMAGDGGSPAVITDPIAAGGSPEMTAPAMTAPEMTAPEMAAPEMAAPADEMTDEMITAADERMGEVTELLRTARWKEMKPAAERLTEQPLTPPQRERAEALHELADLASFYRGGIERGVASLVVGNDFEVTDAFRVITVETGDDLLVIRYNAKNRSYTFDEFPFALAHKLASFAMPADAATTQAAKAVYQSLAPKATDAHRQEAIEWLESIEEEVEGADPKRMAQTIQSLFSDPG